MSTPVQATPERPRFWSWGMLIHRCSHQEELSPVHCKAWRCRPAYPPRVTTNGLSPGGSLQSTHRPVRGVARQAGVPCARYHEWPLAGAELQESFAGGAGHQGAVGVVDLGV